MEQIQFSQIAWALAIVAVIIAGLFALWRWRHPLWRTEISAKSHSSGQVKLGNTSITIMIGEVKGEPRARVSIPISFKVVISAGRGVNEVFEKEREHPLVFNDDPSLRGGHQSFLIETLKDYGLSLYGWYYPGEKIIAIWVYKDRKTEPMPTPELQPA